MGEAILGPAFDVHGGGSDLIFPHHENEEAQTHAGHGHPLARLWVHNGMVRLEEAKMAKSVGNIFLLHEALDAYGRDALIMYFCTGHYRQPIEFDDERLEQAKASVQRVRDAGRGLVAGPSPSWSADLKESFFAALAEDYNTPAALAAVFEWIREANRAEEGTVGSTDLGEMLDVLGLANLLAEGEAEVPDRVRQLVDSREAAREARDWDEADRLRDEIRSLGWEVRDSIGGPQLLPVE
jgi:cysteinyl-tRNA synthetase